MSSEAGVSGVVREAVAGAAAAIARREDPEQLDLVAMLPPTRLTDRGQLEKVRNHVREGARARGAGRPQGATNIATREAKEFVRKVFGDPMVERARWLLHSPASLAEELNCTVAEAFDRLDRIRADMMRYFYAPLSPVDDKGRAVPLFNLVFGDGASGGEAGAAPWLRDPEVAKHIEQNQGLSEAAEAVSQGDSRTVDVSD